MALLFKHLTSRFRPSLRAFTTNSKPGEKPKPSSSQRYTGRLFDPELFDSPIKDINKFFYPMPELDLNYISYNAETQEYQLKVIKSTDYFHKKRVVLLGFVGAFIPECTDIFLPSWADAFAQYQKEFDMDEFIGVSANDVYVMQAFAKKLDFKEKMSYIADPNLALTTAFEKVADLNDINFGFRSQRYTGFLINNKVTSIHQCAYNRLMYVEAMGPEYIEELCNDPFIKSRFFHK